jgi:hypothetical protein
MMAVMASVTDFRDGTTVDREVSVSLGLRLDEKKRGAESGHLQQ